MLRKHIYNIIIITVFLLQACNQGLAPVPAAQKSFLKGLITYVGGKNAWTSDSIYAIRVAAFKNYPFKDSTGIIDEILGGDAYFTFSSLPIRVDTSSFFIEIPDAPVEIKYIGVAMQFDTVITAEKVIGIYTITGDRTKPDSILIPKGQSPFINIIVNFDSLPPQPFK